MIIDLDSHLREGYFADQVYKLAPPFEEYTPICIKEGEPHERRFKTKFERQRGSGEGNSSAYNHSYMYDPKENWKGGDIARRQVVGYDMAKRLQGNALESLDKQVLFPPLASPCRRPLRAPWARPCAGHTTTGWPAW